MKKIELFKLKHWYKLSPFNYINEIFDRKYMYCLFLEPKFKTLEERNVWFETQPLNGLEPTDMPSVARYVVFIYQYRTYICLNMNIVITHNFLSSNIQDIRKDPKIGLKATKVFGRIPTFLLLTLLKIKYKLKGKKNGI